MCEASSGGWVIESESNPYVNEGNQRRDTTEITKKKEEGIARITGWIALEDEKQQPKLALWIWYADQIERNGIMNGTRKLPKLLRDKYNLPTQDVREISNQLVAVYFETPYEVLIEDCNEARQLELVAA